MEDKKSFDPLSFVPRVAQLQSCLDILMRKRPKNAKHSVLDEPIAMFELLIRQECQRIEYSKPILHKKQEA